MPDEPNTTQEAPIADMPPNSESQLPIAPPEAPGATGTGDIPESNKEAPPKVDEIRVEMGNEPKTLENQGVVNPVPEIVNPPVQTSPVVQSAPTPETLKPQMAGNEPLTQTEPVKVEPLKSEPVANEVKPETKSQTSSPQEAKPPVIIIPPVIETFKTKTRENLTKAQQTIQNRKRNKLNMILNLFSKKSKIKNDEVEKLLHVSDATATRYLKILEKEGKIKKEEKKGKLGKWVSYFKI